MKQTLWAWVAGAAIFAAVVGFWVWLLPGNLRSASGGKDAGFAGIFSSVKDTGKALAPDLSKLQQQVDKSLAGFDKAIAETAQAQAIDEVKKKIETDAVKKKIETSLINGQENAAKNQ